MNEIVRTDPRLDRLPQFDPRSLNFPIRTLLPSIAKIPRSYMWSCKVDLDQGSEGACVGFGWSNELAARPAADPGVTNQTAHALYKKAQTLDEWPGEDYEGSSVLAGAKAVQALYPHAMDSYHWALGIEDVVLTIGYLGPVVLGVNWYNSMFNPDAAGIIRVSGSIAGGHCILANGVNAPAKLVHLKNSWGSGWGHDGGAWISFDDLSKLLKDQGEGCVPTGRHLVKIK